ncbi:unnamed protein product [Linum trigynum]|uniref:Uncharacterized protein n=1 Tax=Linum trigynum TaxID=586398 RepID=A0AAV2EEY4_9ROSI
MDNHDSKINVLKLAKLAKRIDKDQKRKREVFLTKREEKSCQIRRILKSGFEDGEPFPVESAEDMQVAIHLHKENISRRIVLYREGLDLEFAWAVKKAEEIGLEFEKRDYYGEPSPPRVNMLDHWLSRKD